MPPVEQDFGALLHHTLDLLEPRMMRGLWPRATVAWFIVAALFRCCC